VKLNGAVLKQRRLRSEMNTTNGFSEALEIATQNYCYNSYRSRCNIDVGDNASKLNSDLESESRFLLKLSNSIKHASEIISKRADQFKDSPSFLRDMKVSFDDSGNIVFNAEVSTFDEEDGEKKAECVSFTYNTTRSRWNGSRSGVGWKSVIESSGACKSYLAGVIDAMQSLSNESMLRMIQDAFENDLRLNCRKEYVIQVLQFINVNGISGVLDVMFGEGLNDRKSDFRDQSKAIWDAFSESRNSICSQHSMPEVPAPDVKFEAEDKPGIYFIWNGDSVCYVGKSISVKNRIKSHGKKSYRSKVSAIYCEEPEIHCWELFYIWLLRPPLNGQVIEEIRSRSKVDITQETTDIT